MCVYIYTSLCMWVLVVQLLRCVWLFPTPWSAACQAFLSFIIYWSLLKFMSTELVMPSNHFGLCHLFLLLPSIFSSITVFSNETALCIRWPKYWSFSFSINPPTEYSQLISFRNNWFDLLAAQDTLKILLQHHNSKASILCQPAFCMVQLSHPYTTTGKIIALTIQTFVSKVMSLLFNMQSRFVIAFLPRSKCLNFVAAVTICSDFEVKEKKICLCFHFFTIYLTWRDGTRCQDLSFLNVEVKVSFLSLLFHLHQEALYSSLLSEIRIVSSSYVKLLIFPPAILIPACRSSNPAFPMMYSVC